VLVVMKRDATKAEIDGVVQRIGELGLSAIPLPGAERTAIGTFGVAAREYADQLESLPGVAEIVLVSRPFKLSSREVHPADSVVRIGDVPIGNGQPLAVLAGPCSVESREQTMSTARAVRAAGASLLRGGAYKPSTSPYHFRGLGPSGLELLSEARAATGLPVVTEVLTPADVELVASHADCLQIGARNMQNFSLLDACGEQPKPVLLKRGMSATVEELLLSAEYILAKGNQNVILCERGIRTFEKYTRNTFDINAIPLLKKLSHLPVVADPFFILAPGRVDRRTFGKQAHLLGGIRGPLAVEGGTTSADRSLKSAVLLPGEDNLPPFRVAAQPPEWQQIDTLNIYGDGSQQDLTGNLTSTALTGLNMGPGLDFTALCGGPCPFQEPGKYPGGISYGSVSIDPVTHVFTTDGNLSTVEIVNVMLGQGNDHLTIASTLQPGGDFNPITGLRGELAHHGGITAVHGGGNQPLKVDGTFTEAAEDRAIERLVDLEDTNLARQR